MSARGLPRLRTSRMRRLRLPDGGADRPTGRTQPVPLIHPTRSAPLPDASTGARRYWDAKIQRWTVQILPGELYVASTDEVITTVLGSCVSTCIRDPHRAIGGVNHFMLPHAPRGAPDPGAAERYGTFALEHLINQVLRAGGRRADLEVKVFGGGRVVAGGGDIGAANVAFVRAFLARDNLVIASEDVGEHVARRLRYWPLTGLVQVKRMPMALAARVVDVEARAAAQLVSTTGPIELF